jgi:pantoate ligase/cytidylate kinase
MEGIVHRFKTIAGLGSYLESKRHEEIGFVPTMGALHIGHMSLIKRAIAENNLVVVSIFVNPLQFSPTEDLAKYPRQLQQDYQLCEQLGVDVVFAPDAEAMGMTAETNSQSAHNTVIIPPANMTLGLCGEFRPGHFQGVATIVTKLFNIVQPNRAYFGEKDAQQLAIIRRLVADLNIPVKIRACETIREPSGLAYSSRNQYLSPTEKEQALALSRSLQQAELAFSRGETKAENLLAIVRNELVQAAGLKLQYVELVHPDTLESLENIEDAGLLAIACYLGSTRLIDNVILKCPRKPIIAIDGPAGAGKSTVTRRVASALGLLYLDTGAMYRAVTWLAMQSGIPFEDEEAIARLIKGVNLELIAPDANDLPVVVKINGEDVTQVIRTPEVTANVSAIAAMELVRDRLVKQQQKCGEKGGIIAEGRDIGTNVFPDADLKIFLTASVQERAKRRYQDFQKQGQAIDLEQLATDIQIRDKKDSSRAIAALTKAKDAIEINTDELTIEEVIEKIISLYQKKQQTKMIFHSLSVITDKC